MKKFLMGSEENALSQSYIWNSLCGIIGTGFSPIVLLVLSRTNPIEDAGVFSLAFAVANLVLTVAAFNIRNFQVSDVNGKYSFSEYVTARMITCGMALLYVVFFLIKGIFGGGYSFDKCLIITVLCVWKIWDAFEDVIDGLYQRKGRLDIAARCAFVRNILILGAIVLLLCFTHNLWMSAICMLVVYLVSWIFCLKCTYPYFNERIIVRFNRKTLYLLLETISLFLCSFITIYIANLPKYAIDELGTETMQACYGYVFMPNYVVSVIATFLYQPSMTSLSIAYGNREKDFFCKTIKKQIVWIGLFWMMILIGGYLLGVPVLSVFFNVDLFDYKAELMILLVGSGFVAMIGLLNAVLTIMRYQKLLLFGSVIAVLGAFLLSRKMFIKYETIGVATMYSGIVFVQMMIYVVGFAYALKKEFKSEDKG